jgi:chromosome segregation ATPase
LSHPKSRRDDLLREYRESNQLVLDELKEQEKKLRKIADSVPEAAELEIEIAMLQKSIDQHRQTRKNVARHLRRVRNVGKTGIAYWNPDRTKMFSMRIYPESSSNN